MPGVQEAIAIAIVILVAVRLVWRYRARRAAGSKAGACDGCASSAPPSREAPVHFYRRRKDAGDGEAQGR